MISSMVSNHFTSSRSKTLSDPEYAEKLTKEDIDHVEAANKRDLRRFLEADGNQDGQLDIEEFSAFLHPHAHDHMQGGVERKLVCSDTLMFEIESFGQPKLKKCYLWRLSKIWTSHMMVGSHSTSTSVI